MLAEGRTYCELHGPQNAFSCAECDKGLSEEELAARQIPDAASVSVPRQDLQDLINAAVAKAVAEKK